MRITHSRSRPAPIGMVIANNPVPGVRSSLLLARALKVVHVLTQRRLGPEVHPVCLPAIVKLVTSFLPCLVTKVKHSRMHNTYGSCCSLNQKIRKQFILISSVFITQIRPDTTLNSWIAF